MILPLKLVLFTDRICQARRKKIGLVNCLFHFRSSAPECWRTVLLNSTLDVVEVAFHIACQRSTSEIDIDRATPASACRLSLA